MILGEGKARPELEALVAELGIEADVALPGFVANPYPYMARAAVFAMSSAWEGLPNALIEALALGATVVSTDCPSGPREILEEGRWGQLVPVGDVDRLADAMADALKSPNSSDREEAVRRFTRTESVSRFLRAIDR
jgi:glycosyltransferase involved in cell wall biosynthesis